MYGHKYHLSAGEFAVCYEFGFNTDAAEENHSAATLLILGESDGSVTKVGGKIIWQHVD